MTTLSFQEHVMSWWKQRKNDVRISRKKNIELKVCMRRKFVSPSYDKNKERNTRE